MQVAADGIEPVVLTEGGVQAVSICPETVRSAREMRWAIVASGTRNASVISRLRPGVR